MSQLVQINQSSPSFDCQTCGACCQFYARSENGILADTEVKDNLELAHFAVEDIKFQWPDGDREEVRTEGFFMNIKPFGDGHACVALDGVPGNVSCSAYEIRPTACREFEVGSQRCLYVRRWAGFKD